MVPDEHPTRCPECDGPIIVGPTDWYWCAECEWFEDGWSLEDDRPKT